MKTIVVGFEGSEASRRALERAATLAEALGSTVIVVGVELPLEAPLAVPAVGVPVVLEPSPEDHAEEVHELEAAQAFLASRNIPAEVVAERGAPGDRIVAVAKARNADLIVVGSRHLGFMERLLEGSVSRDVERRAPCDVLIVH